ncbi:NlpC/P60 family protein [Tsuneonella sp. CC-YZS046]|uniref:NlpC/P60 family protein n=1 Tax=Tsuneonella sp. CC-YZS046 TaxID=3042152 RepID=UPI002D767C6C|nr:NlpC/P60 family protein [Tsuneonella sp. CC-YZS046]WRO65816.1 NlpC/P60 family protein [Tsuneonella sp. CC-YZS046]
MSGDGTALAKAAEALAGAPFRLHGRDPETGLDCVGLCLAALAAIGRPVRVPACYGLRNRSIASLLRFADEAGLAEAVGPIQPGDIILTRPGAAQFHLSIAAGPGRFIHAHAGLRRVVVTPGPLVAPVLRHWRITPFP